MAYEPTHDVPASGLPAFAEPDVTPGPAGQLVPGLDVQLLERREDWAYIECSNGWKAWVNGTLLVARAAPQPTAAAPAPPPQPEPTPAPAPVAPAAAPAAPAPAAPAPAWGTPEATAPAAASTGGISLGPGHIVALVGAVVVALTTLLNWIDVEGSTLSAHNIPAAFLLNTDNAEDGGLGVGWLLILLMVVVVVGMLLHNVRWLAIVGGALGVIVVLLFFFQINSLLDDARDEGVDIGFFDFVTYWPFLTLAGAIAAVVGGVMLTRRT